MKERFDVVVVGAGIAGSVAARYAAQNGLKTLFLEKLEVPRQKACSGIQFGYFERLLGRRIPKSKLCTNELRKVRMALPSGRGFGTRFKMFNFWRHTFDHWLNGLAADAGADFRDGTSLKSFARTADSYELALQAKGGAREEIRTKYLIAADGLNSQVRKRLRPAEFQPKKAAWAINWYYKGNTGAADPNTLYMFFNVEFCTEMFAWAYFKDDLLCIGTGTDNHPQDYIKRFTRFVTHRFGVRAPVVKREGYTQVVRGDPWLGQGNLLMTGDAAGLVDLARGVCMDSAALSARHAIHSIIEAGSSGRPALDHYNERMEKILRQIQENKPRKVSNFKTNEALARFMRKWVFSAGPKMLLGGLLNKYRPWHKVILLP